MKNFDEMIEESLQQVQAPDAGEIITTSVIQITNEDVVLDVGAKTEARIKKSEFQTVPEIGDEIEVYVEKSGTNYLKLSYKKAQSQKSFIKVKEAANDETVLKAKIKEVVKGGFKVLLEGHVEAFMPLSQVSLRRIDNPEEYKGQDVDVKVLRFEKRGRNLNIVVSRRPILEEEQSKKTEELYSRLEVGMELECKVLRLNPKSVIVEIEGIERGLVRLGDLSWDRNNHPKEVVAQDEIIKAKIIELDKEKKKILLSVKDLKEDPWVLFSHNNSVGDKVEGEVVKISPRYVFVRVQEGIEGIVRFEDLSWSRGIKKPEEIVKMGDKISVQILTLDAENKKMSLGIKQVHGDPWADIEVKYPIGKKVKGTITGKQDFGLFVELERGVEALLHKNDIDWTAKNIDLETYQVGDDIEGIVLKLDVERRKISMGIKQLFDNPWKNFVSENPKNSIVKGNVKAIQEDGLVIGFGEEVEGFLPKNQLANKVEDLASEFEVGQELTMMVADVNLNRNQLRLSIREMIRRERDKEVQKYMNVAEDSSEMTLGDFMGNSLDKLKNKISKDDNSEAEEN